MRGAAGAVRRTSDAGSSCQGRHHPSARDLADRMVGRVRHVHVAGAVHRHAIGVIKRSGAGPVPRTYAPDASRQFRHHAATRDLPDCEIGRVRHVNVARAVHCRARRIIKPRGAAGAVRRTRGTGGSRQLTERVRVIDGEGGCRTGRGAAGVGHHAGVAGCVPHRRAGNRVGGRGRPGDVYAVFLPLVTELTSTGGHHREACRITRGDGEGAGLRRDGGSSYRDHGGAS